MLLMQALVVGDILLDTIAEVDATAVDLTCRVDSRDCEICFDYGSKIPVEEQRIYPGGNAANVAVGMAKLGITSRLASAVGDDDAGHRLLSELAQQGVLIDQVHTTPSVPTSSSFIVRYMGERTIFSYHAAHTITVENGVADLVYLTSSRSPLTTLFQQAVDGSPHATVVFQPGTSQLRQGVRLLAPLLQQTDLLILNEGEAATLLGVPLRQLPPKPLLHALLDTKASEVVITAGERGMYASDGRDFIHCDILKSAVRKDTTGVGDAFAAAYSWSRYVEKGSLRQAATAGTVNAGSVISHSGAQEGLMDATALRQILQTVPVKVSSI